MLNNLNAQDGYPHGEADHAVADKVSSYWANFIKTANPNDDVFDGLNGLDDFVTTTPERIMGLGDNCDSLALAVNERRVGWRAMNIQHIINNKPLEEYTLSEPPGTHLSLGIGRTYLNGAAEAVASILTCRHTQ